MMARRFSGGLLVAALSLGLALNACTGLIGDGNESCPGCPDETTPGDPDPAAALKTTRFPRLSHFQWENTIQDLLDLPSPSGLSANFSGDPLGGVFDNNENVLLVTPNLWGDYQTAAEDLSAIVADDPAQLAKILPAGLPTDPTERARGFIEGFGKRAYRRPLTAGEVDAYMDLFAQAPQLIQGGDDFTKGVKLTLQAFLQSPHFLYRLEGASDVGDDGLIQLSGWEIATKLSYLLWNTMPDQQLFDAAESGQLDTPEGIMTQAQRMLEDGRSRPTVASFHAQLYQFDHYHDLYKDEILFPGFPADIGDDMALEAEMFIEDVVYGGGGLNELLTSPFTYVNADLAAIYGLSGTFGSGFERVELDASERAGFLTRLGFLASNATPKEQNTIHRGVFVNLRVLCNTLPSPPDNVDGLPSSEGFPTNRERVESHTGLGTCGEGCHQTLINPPGYALENYNAIGAFVTTENGSAVDAQATYAIDGAEQTFTGAIEMSRLIAESDQAHLCYAKHWLEFGYGREEQDGDKTTIEELGAGSKSGSVKDLMLALTQTTAFRTRAPAEEVTP